MRGNFSLNVVGDDCQHLIFCKLDGGNGGEPEGFSIANLAYLSKESMTTVGRVVAHDTIEHSVSHRTKRTVTVEEELRALGAIRFVRPQNEIKSDIAVTMDYLVFQDRKLRRLPIQFQNLPDVIDCEELADALDSSEVTYNRALLKNVQQHMNYGHWCKSRQFDNMQWKADAAFRLIEQYVPQALRCLDRYVHAGISFYFDSEAGIIRHRMKHYPKY